jgi:outer membrane biosynthesis protein TonB
MFMAATAMATTVSTLAATAMVKAESADPVAVTCSCEAPVAAPAVAPATPVEPPAAAPSMPEPIEQAEQAEQAEQSLPKAEVEGALDKDLVRRIVKAHIGEVRYCYNEGLMLDPELAGRVVVRFTVGPEGKVTRSEVESTTIEGDVPECIAEAAARWLFPRPAGRTEAVVTYPFLLEPG